MAPASELRRRALRVAAGVITLLASCADPALSDWQVFRAEDGFPGGGMSRILEDASGTLWFDAIRFDGLHFVIDPAGLPLYSDPSGSLWFSREASLSTLPSALRCDGVRCTTFTVPTGLTGGQVTGVFQDRAGNLWFSTGAGLRGSDYGEGVTRYDGVGWTRFTSAEGLADDKVQVMLQDRAGNLWFGTRDGASRYDGATWTSYLRGSPLTSVAADSSGNVWFGLAYGGVARWDGTSVQYFYTDAPSATALLVDRVGNLWVGFSRGGAPQPYALSRYDGVSWRFYTRADGLAGRSVQAIYQDHNGNLWFGSSGGVSDAGVSRFDGASVQSFGRALGSWEPLNRAIFEDRSGSFWIAAGDSGVSRYDPRTDRWTKYTRGDGLASDQVRGISEDRAGRLWFACGTAAVGPGGATSYDPGSGAWTTFRDSLADTDVQAILEDSTGFVWIAGQHGLTRLDPRTGSWWRLTEQDFPALHYVYSIYVDRASNLWVATYTGVLHFDGSNWETLPEDDVRAILEDREGRFWFGNGQGVSRYDPRTRTRTQFKPLGDFFYGYAGPFAIVEDRFGILWFATIQGLSRFDGEDFKLFTVDDGLADDWILSTIGDHAGRLWIGTSQGVTVLEPDRVPPQAVLVVNPATLIATRQLTLSFAAAFGETRGIELSYHLDGGSWSPWAATNFWNGGALTDGPHTFEVRARDRLRQVSLFPARARFAVDATPPAPVLTAPAFGAAASDTLIILGTAEDARLKSYRIDIRPAGAESWNAPVSTRLKEWFGPQTGVLARIDTRRFPDGTYELRLAVTDTLGLTGTAFSTFIIDNQEPRAAQTSPARVNALTGGDAWTTNREVHLYFPPRAFQEDAVVTLEPLAPGLAPDTLANGAVRVLPGYAIGWGSERILKTVVAEFSFAGVTPPSGTLALYARGEGATWHRLGGTLDAAVRRITASIMEAGPYALFAETAAAPGAATLSTLSLTPRVFSPGGGFASPVIAIGFTLGQASTVTIKVHNRAGRLIREVASGLSLGAGVNLVRWDGRDRDGQVVRDDLYVVTVEALGQTRTQTLAVVR